MKKWKMVLTIQMGFLAGVLFAVSCGSDGGFNSIAQNVLTALGITYDNSASGLAATNVQDAIDELATCPSDMIDSSNGFCIDADTNTSATYANAVNTCQSEGKYLCDSNQIVEACGAEATGEISGLNGIPQGQNEWGSGAFQGSAGQPYFALLFVNPAGAGDCTQGSGASDSLTNTHNFRCCRNIPG